MDCCDDLEALLLENKRLRDDIAEWEMDAPRAQLEGELTDLRRLARAALAWRETLLESPTFQWSDETRALVAAIDALPEDLKT